MKELNALQKRLLSFGYPRRIIESARDTSRYYRLEVAQYVYDSLVEKRRLCSADTKQK